MWSLWESRNAVIFGTGSLPAAHILNRALMVLEEWLSATHIAIPAAPAATMQQSTATCRAGPGAGQAGRPPRAQK
ncbi:hypothetical protein LguiA_003903 [Lonicera macranthoides]